MAEADDQLAAFIDKYDLAIAALGRKVMAAMKKRLPGAVITVWDNYNALAIGFAPDEKVRTTPLSVVLYPRWVRVFFLHGAHLPDPEKLLEGKGSTVRSIRVDSPARLKEPAIDAMITAAVMHVGWRLDPKAKHRLMIKAISPKQRPRRP